ncbi:MAG TPA: amylo-alpha-1,6-glucosidase [Ktedonobacteraceae bacterium]|nr:amylo-alpha-1,6-glucosidase [Ktedonobacteraceae bacterium]
MPIAFDRGLCCDFNETISREWLITNGLGGYAAGTVSGALTRLQHGLLVASLRDSATPQLLLAKIDEEIVFDQRTYELGTNEYRDGTLNPAGFVHLEAFRLEEGFPVFTYHLGGIDGIVLEKRIWMPHGYNTTYIQYRVLRRTDASNVHSSTTNRGFGRYYDYPEAAQQALSLTLLPFSAYRPCHQLQYGKNDWHFQVQVHSNGQQHSFQEGNREEQPEPLTLPNGVTGCTIRATEGAVPYSLFVVGHPASQATFIPTGVWYWHFLRRHEKIAGRPAIDDLYLPGVIRAKLWAGEGTTLTVIATTEELSSLDFTLNQLNTSYKRSVESQRNLLLPQRYFGEGGETSHYLHTLPLSSAPDPHTSGEEYLRFLLQAADRFLVQRPIPSSEYATSSYLRPVEKTPSVLSDYYGLAESTRDTLIALPGLTLVTGRHDEAYRILRHVARSFKQGLLPDRLPASGNTAVENDYNSVDTALWFFYALDHYLHTTRDYELLDELYQKLVDCIDWYRRGTLNGIQVDSDDGLLRAQQPGKALTWMNAHVNNTPVTPRQGKPVDVNALWYHALALMHEWSQRQVQVGHTSYTSSYYQEMAQRCQKSFQQRFWNASGGYLYDVIDGPEGDDAALRPNQLLALSLRYPVLEQEHRQQVFTIITQKLLTPYGLRTLSPDDTKYQGHLKEQHEEQQKALHQGSTWPWLIGPYIDALLNLSGSSPSAVASNRQGEEKYQKNYGQIFWWQQSLSTLDPSRKLFSEGVLGMIGGVYDGELPQQASYQVASVVSVGELLRVYNELANVVASSLAITKTNLVTMPQWS